MPTSKRMAALLEAHPNPDPAQVSPKDLYAGWYDAPNGHRYFGLGTVIEVGTTHSGSYYVKVEPRDPFHVPGTAHDFFDPRTDKDMPRPQYPNWTERIGNFTNPDRRLFTTDNHDLKPGDIAPGFYTSAEGDRFFGLGRIVCTNRGPRGEFADYMTEPMRGGYRFWEFPTTVRIPDHALPRSPYSGNAETQARVSPSRPRRRRPLRPFGGKWHGGLPCITRKDAPTPNLGMDMAGAYFAPDGQWFAGIGRVVAVGVTHVTEVQLPYVFVEPIPGKGPEYDFFHPCTMEWMDELPSNPIPGVVCSPAQRNTLPPRWRELPAIRDGAEVGAESHGRYCPPGAPRRDVYIGIGRAVRAGKDKAGRTWVEVVPFANSEKSDRKYKFFDPFTGKDMPDDYMPDESQ